MKRTSLLPAVFLLTILLSGCGKTDIWQGYYYKHGKQENEIFGPVFTTYDACKSWAIKQVTYEDDMVNCSKNCYEGLGDGTAVCEEVVRNRTNILGGKTFDDYKE